ncbi:MAG TPA: carbohydrate kinase family protein [Blastocatellia bacterium]|nr:carbohydrate kinase family protein [Blastocatellia bacterium]
MALMTGKEWDVVTVGDIFIDLVMSGFPRWPRPGEEAFASTFTREVGGGAAITACGLARLGLRVGILAVVGAEDGEWVIKRLHQQGVETDLIRHDPEEPTALTVSVSSSEDRAFFTYAGANRRLTEVLGEDEARRSLARARHVHLACALDPGALVALSRDFHSRDCSVSLDIGWHESWLRDPRSLDALREIDLFFPNEREAQCLTGESEPEAILRALARAGLPAVALKRGPAGAALLYQNELYFVEPYPVIPIDTTGAGDCFDAGFLAAWLGGESPERCLRRANICGALSTRRLGGIAAFPTPEEIDAAGLAESSQQREGETVGRRHLTRKG